MKAVLACLCAALFSGSVLAQQPARPARRRVPRQEPAVDSFRGPQHLAVVIDCSAQSRRAFERSMRQATRLVERLTDRDTVSIVVFDDAAELLLPATPAADKASIRAKLQGLNPKGMRALFAGIAKGAEQVRRNTSEGQARRVVVLSGGEGPLIGPGSPDDIRTLAEALRKEGISLVRPQGGKDGGAKRAK